LVIENLKKDFEYSCSADHPITGSRRSPDSFRIVKNLQTRYLMVNVSLFSDAAEGRGFRWDADFCFVAASNRSFFTGSGSAAELAAASSKSDSDRCPNSDASACRDSSPDANSGCDTDSIANATTVANAESLSDASESFARASFRHCAATIASAFVHSATVAAHGCSP
jgi:hypothetical protein